MIWTIDGSYANDLVRFYTMCPDFSANVYNGVKCTECEICNNIRYAKLFKAIVK